MNSATSSGSLIGTVDLGDQPREEAAPQPLLERLDRLRGPVRGDDDLLACTVEGVVGVEELLLQALPVLDELDVVDEQDVALPVLALERQGGLGADRVDEVVEEVLRGDVADPHLGVVRVDVVADGVQEVGLAEAGRPVDEERVVGLARGLRNGLRGGERKPVRARRHERVEGEARVEAGRVGLVRLDGRGTDGRERRGRHVCLCLELVVVRG